LFVLGKIFDSLGQVAGRIEENKIGDAMTNMLKNLHKDESGQDVIE
jgi:hypothetical protein